MNIFNLKIPNLYKLQVVSGEQRRGNETHKTL